MKIKLAIVLILLLCSCVPEKKQDDFSKDILHNINGKSIEMEDVENKYTENKYTETELIDEFIVK